MTIEPLKVIVPDPKFLLESPKLVFGIPMAPIAIPSPPPLLVTWDWIGEKEPLSKQVYTLAIQLMRRDGLLPDPLLFSPDKDWNHKQFHEALSSLSPERRRRATRRFRKAWRAALVKSGKPLSMACKLNQEAKSSLVRDFYLERAKSMVECPS